MPVLSTIQWLSVWTLPVDEDDDGCDDEEPGRGPEGGSECAGERMRTDFLSSTRPVMTGTEGSMRQRSLCNKGADDIDNRLTKDWRNLVKVKVPADGTRQIIKERSHRD